MEILKLRWLYCLKSSCNLNHMIIYAALLVAATYSPLGGDEEDGGQEIGRTDSYQLHRDLETVSCSGESSWLGC